jgi:predicted DNA-binding protein with PD1-like motif
MIMEIKRQQPYTFVHLQPNESLIPSLKHLCKNYSIKNAVVISGIGQLKNITLGYFKEKGNYSPQKFSQPHELISLTGTLIIQDNEILPHLHVIIGDENKQTFGGHLLEATVEITNEIIIRDIPFTLSRKLSDETGLMEINLSS